MRSVVVLAREGLTGPPVPSSLNGHHGIVSYKAGQGADRRGVHQSIRRAERHIAPVADEGVRQAGPARGDPRQARESVRRRHRL
jgi:hypothetical protein